MNILKTIEILRKLFSKKYISELPAYPDLIKNSWCHPDIYLNLKNNIGKDYFTFQTFKGNSSILTPKAVKTPDLIWLTNVKTERNDFISPIKSFLEGFAMELGFEEGEEYFDFEHSEKLVLNTGEKGSLWTILLAGAECGHLSIYSELPGDLVLENPRFVVTLQLNKIIYIYYRNKLETSLQWSDNLLIEDTMALIANERTSDYSEARVSEVLEELDMAMTKSHSARSLLCKAFETYNGGFDSLNEKADLYHQFNALFKNLVDKVTNDVQN